MITEKQYKKALAIVKAYRKQSSPSIVKKRFTIDDLVISEGTIDVPSLTLDNFSEDDCHKLYNLISEKIKKVEWCNVDSLGYLTISFSMTFTVTDEMIAKTLYCLNDFYSTN